MLLFPFLLLIDLALGTGGGKRSIYVSGGAFTRAVHGSVDQAGLLPTPCQLDTASGIPVHAGNLPGWLPRRPPYAES